MIIIPYKKAFNISQASAINLTYRRKEHCLFGYLLCRLDMEDEKLKVLLSLLFVLLLLLLLITPLLSL